MGMWEKLMRRLGWWPTTPPAPPLPPPPPPPKPLLTQERDLPYGTHELEKADVDRPEGMVEGDTAITDVMVHGGGWQNDLGDKGNDGVVANKRPHSLAQGHIFISANYPLWTKDNGITPLDEQASIAKLLAWVQKQPGVDPTRVRLMGHSAGGNLVAEVGVAVSLRQQYGYLPPDNVTCLDSVYDIPKGKRAAQLSGNPRAIAVYDPWGTDVTMQKAGSPTFSVSGPVPRFFLAYSNLEGPGRLAQAQDFADAIVAKGGPTPVVKGYDYDHAGMDSNVGLNNQLTRDIDTFQNG